MESYSQPVINLLLKFSHCINILQFYGRYWQCEELMQLICKDTLDFWRQNDLLISVNIQISKPKLICYNDFNEKLCEYLLENKRYEKYRLNITTRSGRYTDLSFFLKFMSKIEDKSNLEFDQINIDLNHITLDNFNLLISNNSCIKQFVNCIGNWNRIYSNKIKYINPAHYNFINSRYWIGSEKMHSECFTIKKRIENKFSYKLEKMTATKLIISYCNLQKYCNNDLLLSESLENSIKYVRVCLIPKFDFCLMESLLLQLKSKLKLVNYFELHVSALYRIDLNCLIRLVNEYNVKRLIVKRKVKIENTLRFSILNSVVLLKHNDKLALFKIKELDIQISSVDSFNYINEDVMIIRVANMIDMKNIKVIEDPSFLSILSSYYNCCTQKYENMPCLVILNKCIQPNVLKCYKINSGIFLSSNKCKIADTFDYIKKNQLPVVLTFLCCLLTVEDQEKLSEIAKDFNIIGLDSNNTIYCSFNECLKQILLKILNNDDSDIFIKLSNYIQFRNFTEEKRECLKEALENTLVLYNLKYCKYDFKDFIKI